jgi:hypothetical protein
MKRKQAEESGAFAVACPACRAPVGEPCRNYRGQHKQTCGTRLYAEIRANLAQQQEGEQLYLVPPDPSPGTGDGHKL